MKNGNSYLSPRVEARPHPDKGGMGVYAIEDIAQGELVAMWGGKVVTRDEFERLPVDERTHSIQIEEDLFQVPIQPGEPADFVNHSCDPNLGLYGPIGLVAMRDIAAGEELNFDYAMSDSSPYDEFDCACEAYNCRGQVTAEDWRLPDLQERYADYFSPYLQRRIEVEAANLEIDLVGISKNLHN